MSSAKFAFVISRAQHRSGTQERATRQLNAQTVRLDVNIWGQEAPKWQPQGMAFVDGPGGIPETPKDIGVDIGVAARFYVKKPKKVSMD